MAKELKSAIFLAFPKGGVSLDDLPTTIKVFHRFCAADGHYLALVRWPLFRAKAKCGLVPESART